MGEGINESKSCFFGGKKKKINKIELDQDTKKWKLKILKLENGNIHTFYRNKLKVLWIFYTKTLDNLDEMDKFQET